MVLGLRSKNSNKRAAAATSASASLQLDYSVHVQEIKPWPPSQSLRSLRAVVLQWELSADRAAAGRTAPAAPGPAGIVFDESFRFRTTLVREGSSSSGARSGGFRRNVLELSLYEPPTRRDGAAKGQLLGTAAVDLAELGAAGGEAAAASFGVPLNCKRSYRNAAQPVVYVRIRASDRGGSASVGSSLTGSPMSDGVSKDRESVSGLMSGEYAEEEEEEAEIASFTDDDDSSQSSLANADAAGGSGRGGEQAHRENGSEEIKEIKTAKNVETNIDSEPVAAEPVAEPEAAVPIPNSSAAHKNSSSSQSLSDDIDLLDNVDISSSSSQKVSDLSLKKIDTPVKELPPSVAYQSTEEETSSKMAKEAAKRNILNREDMEKTARCRIEATVVEDAVSSTAQVKQYRETQNLVSTGGPENNNGDKKSGGSRDAAHGNITEENVEARQKENSSNEKSADAQSYSTDSSHDSSTIASDESLQSTPVTQQSRLRIDLEKDRNSDLTTSSQRLLGQKGSRTLTSDRLKQMQFSLRSPPQPLGNLRNTDSDQYVEDVKEIDVMEDVSDGGKKSILHGRINIMTSTKSSSYEVKNTSISKRNNLPDNKVKELERRVEMLKEELREAAAIEIGLYSIVAEHGSSVHKVHTPARRLSRVYIHASTKQSPERKATTARSIVSGLILAAKACGNDVPRLVFWLSNSVVLRGIVSQVVGNTDCRKSGSHSAVNGSKGKFSLKWESGYRKKEQSSFSEELEDWENLCTFTSVLERIEAWIFSRIVESIWWQTLTPHMQSTNKASEPKTSPQTKDKFGRQSSSGDQHQANLPIEIWKKAFDGACGRLCPVKAEGHECGCLPMLSRLVMEQCVARLDVAMFNAILRESDDDIPTDPVSDPISDPKVLPIPPGKLSFGAGAQLKNAIGNWSRWLTDLFGMDEDDSPRVKNEVDDERLDLAVSSKSFLLLNAMSDLLMLPKDMLSQKSIRKEVCPTFTASMIKRILTMFSPDEFCPDPIPDEVLEALEAEDPLETNEEGIKDFPCNASPAIYRPPSADLIENIIGNVRRTSSLQRSGSSIIRKCHTSDDELDELDSPLSSILLEKPTPCAEQKMKGNASAIRYQLLRDVWRSED